MGRGLRGRWREAKGLRGPGVLQQGPCLQAVRARWGPVQGWLPMGRARAGAGPTQRLQWWVRGGQSLWVQGRGLLDVGVGSRAWRLQLGGRLGGRG